MVTPENSSDKEMFSVLVGLVLSCQFCSTPVERRQRMIGRPSGLIAALWIAGHVGHYYSCCG